VIPLYLGKQHTLGEWDGAEHVSTAMNITSLKRSQTKPLPATKHGLSAEQRVRYRRISLANWILQTECGENAAETTAALANFGVATSGGFLFAVGLMTSAISVSLRPVWEPETRAKFEYSGDRKCIVDSTGAGGTTRGRAC
jgi:hypothetical protein